MLLVYVCTIKKGFFFKMETVRQEIDENFEVFFKRPVEQKKMNNLIKYFGQLKVLAILVYLTITHTSDKPINVRDNPYGLIYKIGTNKKFNWREFDLTQK